MVTGADCPLVERHQGKFGTKCGRRGSAAQRLWPVQPQDPYRSNATRATCLPVFTK